jgi:hypothetical protein
VRNVTTNEIIEIGSELINGTYILVLNSPFLDCVNSKCPEKYECNEDYICCEQNLTNDIAEKTKKFLQIFKDLFRGILSL